MPDLNKTAIVISRKTGWTRAEAAGDSGSWRRQAILGRGRWAELAKVPPA